MFDMSIELILSALYKREGVRVKILRGGKVPTRVIPKSVGNLRAMDDVF